MVMFLVASSDPTKISSSNILQRQINKKNGIRLKGLYIQHLVKINIQGIALLCFIIMILFAIAKFLILLLLFRGYSIAHFLL